MISTLKRCHLEELCDKRAADSRPVLLTEISPITGALQVSRLQQVALVDEVRLEGVVLERTPACKHCSCEANTQNHDRHPGGPNQEGMASHDYRPSGSCESGSLRMSG